MAMSKFLAFSTSEISFDYLVGSALKDMSQNALINEAVSLEVQAINQLYNASPGYDMARGNMMLVTYLHNIVKSIQILKLQCSSTSLQD